MEAMLELVMDLDSTEGRALRAEIAATQLGRRSTPAFVQRLRHGRDPELVRLALRVEEAARRAVERFPDADRLLFTPELLEQATAHPVSAHRAGSLLNCGRVLDLGCGAGADLTRLAGAGVSVVGLERDPLAAALAQRNLAALDLAGEVHCGEYPGAVLPPYDALFVDPARRDPGRGPVGARRRFDPAGFSPSPAALRPLLAAAGAWAVKWGPGLDLGPAALTAPGALLEGFAGDDYSLEVVSWRGGVREAVLRGGAARCEAGPVATVLAPRLDVAEATHYRGSLDAAPPPVAAPGAWILEPDGSLLRTGLLNAFAAEHGLALLAPDIAYLTADVPPATPFLRRWRRLETLRFSVGRLQVALDRHGAGRVAVKKRGFSRSPEALLADLRLRGERELVVFIHRDVSGHTAHLAEPEESSA